jgi:class 3 adenylate cyclase
MKLYSSPSTRLAAWLLALIVAGCTAQTVSRSVYLSLTEATLLSGAMGSCPTPTASTCLGGVASALALVRYRTAAFGETHILIPEFDRQTPFVQMHPLNWGVNEVVYDTFGIAAYTSRPSLFQTSQDIEGIVNGTARPFIANVEISADDIWNGYVNPWYVHAATGVAVMYISNSFQPNSLPSVDTAATQIVSMRRHRNTRIVVVLYDDYPTVDAFANDLAIAVANDEHKRMTMPDIILQYGLSVPTPYTRNGSWIGGYISGATVVASVGFTFEFDQSQIPRSTLKPRVVSLNAALSYNIAPIAATMKDATYTAHQVYLKALSDSAAATDPVVGYSANAMPFVRIGNYRMCMAGECPLGNLWTDAMRWSGGNDIAFTTSGGIRGPGWAAGPIKTSDVWGSLPFANMMCRGYISGVTLFELLNQSVTLSTFQGLNTPTGDRLLQTSGLRYTYNTLLNGTGVGAKLIGIDIWNNKTRAYEPIERLKLYKFACDNFVCQSFAPFSDIIRRMQFKGEVYTITDELVQNILGTFLTSTGPYTAGAEGRQINKTDATLAEAQSFNLVQTRAACAENNRWDVETFTCVPCDSGFRASAGGQIKCDAIPIENGDDTIIIAIVIPAVVVVFFLAFAGLARRHASMQNNVRDVANAPRSGRITFIFTDIQDSTKLWSTCPVAMSQALDTHHAVIRSAITAHKGYEVKTAGDSFMIAVGTEDAAMRIAMDIQRNMMKQNYPSAINEVYAAPTEEDLLNIVDNADEIAPRTSDAWHGLRVRIGLHSGEPSVTFDEVVKGYDYYGPPVNVAARTEAIATGGQVTLTRSTADHLSTMTDVVNNPLGFFELKGVPDQVEIFEAMPAELVGKRAYTMNLDRNDKSGADWMDDNASQHTTKSHDDAATDLTEVTVFFTTMMRAIPPKDKKPLLKKIMRCWRVEPALGETIEADETAAALAKRVATAMARERKRLEKVLASSHAASSRRPSALLLYTGGRSPGQGENLNPSSCATTPKHVPSSDPRLVELVEGLKEM